MHASSIITTRIVLTSFQTVTEIVVSFVMICLTFCQVNSEDLQSDVLHPKLQSFGVRLPK